MEYRGVLYTIRTGIARYRWTVVVTPPSGQIVNKAIFGTRQKAEKIAQSIIDKWLEQNQGPEI